MKKKLTTKTLKRLVEKQRKFNRVIAISVIDDLSRMGRNPSYMISYLKKNLLKDYELR